MAAPGLNPQEIALAIIPHVTGGLSFLGSAFIAGTVLTSRPKRGKTYHRLLLAMSLSDAIGSFSYFLSTWPIPQVGPEGVGGWSKACEGCSPYHYAAVGTLASCRAQGWGIQFGTMCTAAYNVVLATHYLLTIRWNFGELRLKRWEPLMLVIPPVIGLGLSLPQLPRDYYNDTNLWCWIKAGWEYDDAVQRTYNARWAFAYAPLWAFIVYITFAQVYLWYTVRNIEKRVERYRKFSPAREQSSQSRSVANQAALYVMGFYVTNLPYTIIAATQRFYNPHTTGGFAALLAVVIFAPLQGFWNLFVYRRKQIFDAARKTYGRSQVQARGARKTIRGVIAMNTGGRNDEGIEKGREVSAVAFSCDTKDATEDITTKAADDGEGMEGGGVARSGECDPLIPAHVSEVYGDDV